MLNKNKVQVEIRGDEVWDMIVNAYGTIAGRAFSAIYANYGEDSLDTEERRSLFLSNPDYIIVRG